MSDTEASAIPPLVLTFAASDPSGGAGMQADLLTLASMGCHPLSVITAITVQDSLGVEGVLAIDSDWVADQARRLLEDMPVDAFKIGVLGSVENIAAIAEIVSDYPDVPLIFDPVLASGRGDELASDDMTHAHARAAAAADDDPHAEQRGGAPARGRRGRGRGWHARAMRGEARARRAASTCSSPARTRTRRDVVNTLYDKSGIVRTDNWPRLAGLVPRVRLHALRRRSPRCSPTASTLSDAVREAQEYTWQALRKAYRPGMGQYLPDRLFWAREEAEARSEDAGSAAPTRVAANDAFELACAASMR